MAPNSNQSTFRNPHAGTNTTQGGTLYVIATPIGNLEDITLRALRILKEVHLIAAEDTRRTAKLLAHYAIPTRLTSLHEHNEIKKSATLLRHLKSGNSLALVSDAGTPLLSDPGEKLVRAVLSTGLKVQTVPGPSAITAALSMSAIDTSSFIFLGFPPSRSNARDKWFSAISEEKRTLIIFESPHRIRTTLKCIYKTFGNRTISLCREMTKKHEDLVIGPINDVLNNIKEPKGEYTVVISGNIDSEKARALPTAQEIMLEFCYLTDKESSSRRSAVKTLADRYSVSSREIYNLIEREKK